MIISTVSQRFGARSTAIGHRPGLLRALAVAAALLGPVLGHASNDADPSLDLTRDDVRSFIDEVVERHGIESTTIESLLGTARTRQAIIDAISRPAEALPWHRYRTIFITDERIDAGVAWWSTHAELIDAAATRYGLDPAVLVAVIGVETYYGRFRGRHRVIDALATLAFDYPRRSAFFRRELEAFLLLSHEEGLDPLAVLGSYAGAMGLPQFISSSYRAYAVDGDGDGRRDLLDSIADATASVGNYFLSHGWRSGEEVTLSASAPADPAAVAHLVNQGRRPYTTVGELRAAGIVAADAADQQRLDALDAAAPATLMALEGAAGTEYWVGLHNLFVITQYNHSPLYALAVFQLAELIRERRDASRGDA
jgi:membrane-bound lytic murein transglycosylase B